MVLIRQRFSQSDGASFENQGSCRVLGRAFIAGDGADFCFGSLTSDITWDRGPRMMEINNKSGHPKQLHDELNASSTNDQTARGLDDAES